MIIIRFSGGLGNQIYQYAFLKEMKLKYPDTVIKMDLSFYKQNYIHNGFELEKIFGVFQNGIENAGRIELLKVRCEIPFEGIQMLPTCIVKSVAGLNARTRSFFTKCGLRNEIKEEIQKKTGDFEKLKADELIQKTTGMNIKKNWYIDGYWQNELFFEEVLPEVLEELCFPDFKDNKNKELEEQIKKNSAVSIHIRRGDYVNSSYDVLTPEYYKKAIQYLEDRKESLTYYIFSDDIQYAEQEFSFLSNKYIVCHNFGENSWCDMKLMSLCKYNILANSSFSNWAGYFNKNRDRIIIYPSQYTKKEKNTDKYGRGWIKLNV